MNKLELRNQGHSKIYCIKNLLQFSSNLIYCFKCQWQHKESMYVHSFVSLGGENLSNNTYYHHAKGNT